MSTTSVIVEHLLAGILALAGAVLIMLAFTGTASIDTAQLKEWSVPTGALLFALAYPIGIAVDEASDGIAWRWQALRRTAYSSAEPLTVFQLLAAKDSDFLSGYFLYPRGRLRMLRSTSLTLPFVTLGGLLFISFRIPVDQLRLLVAVAILGFGGSALCLWAAIRVAATFANRKRELNAVSTAEETRS
jgi:hypothetical protein